MAIIRFLSVFLLTINLANAEDSELMLVKEALKSSLSSKVNKIDVEYDYLNNQIGQTATPSFVRVTRVVQKHGTFNARIYYIDNTAKEISGRYRAYTEVPMVKRYIKRGEVVSEEDLGRSTVDITRSEHNVISNTEQVVGLQARHDLQPGYTLKISDLSRPTLIRENDEVTILYKASSIEVKATGLALKAGGLGEAIKVKNERSNKVITGVIVGRGVVQVKRNHNES
ncbi:MAG: flgA [Rickettsiaceae bacterium]|jgi:flagella basal body P-ring formation protein FlgA|nr:flgA [Rickettsiaceae bacterium]